MTIGVWTTLRSFLDFPGLAALRPGRPGRPATASRRRTVLVLGPSAAGLGGVSSVIKVLLENWAPDRYAIRHLATHAEGGRGAKLAAAARSAREMLACIARREACAVHVHFAANGSFYRKSAFILTAAALGVPVVGHAHSGLFPGFYDGGGPLRRAYVRFVLGRLDRLVVLSREWADYYRGLYSRSEPVVIPNPAVIPPVVARSPKANPVILTLGRLGPNKGTYDILQAAPAVLDRFPGAEFWMGGDGELDEVRRRLKDQPWGSQVRLLGWVSGAEKEAALRAADVFLLPSYAEGLPMALLEAMAYGLPVITTPVGGIPQAVEDGRSGLLIRPGDVAALQSGILGLLSQPDWAASLGAEARRAVIERYAMQTVQARMTAVYDEILHERRRVLAGPGPVGGT